MSLANRLSLFFLATLAIILLGFSTILYVVASRFLHRQLDERMTTAVNLLTAAIDVEQDGMEWEPADRRMKLGVDSRADEVRWAIMTETGRVIDRSANALPDGFPPALPSIPLSDHWTSIFIVETPAWRLAVRRLLLAELLREGRGHPNNEPEDDETFDQLIVVVGLSPVPVHTTLYPLAAALIVSSIALWFACALVSRQWCRHALAPLTRMSQSIQSITAADTDIRLPIRSSGDELDELGVAFNELLDRLQEAFEKQQRFVGDASHQLRTPLAGLLSLVDVTRRRPRNVEEYEHALDQVRRESVRLQGIVESMLFLARSQGESMPPEMSLIDLSEWLPRRLCEEWAAHPRYADIDCRIARSPLWIQAHPSLLAQAVDNLLDNACKYSQPGNPIEVHADSDGTEVAIGVEDCGPGIAVEHHESIFEPFFRSPAARQHGKAGVGLGLAIVRRIMSSMKGSVRYERREQGGSRFVLQVPLVHHVPNVPVAPSTMIPSAP